MLSLLTILKKIKVIQQYFSSISIGLYSLSAGSLVGLVVTLVQIVQKTAVKHR